MLISDSAISSPGDNFYALKCLLQLLLTVSMVDDSIDRSVPGSGLKLSVFFGEIIIKSEIRQTQCGRKPYGCSENGGTQSTVHGDILIDPIMLFINWVKDIN